MWMFEACSKEHWRHTSEIWCLIANVNKSSDSPVYTEADVNPWLKDSETEEQKSDNAGAAELAGRINRLMDMPADLAAKVLDQWQLQESERARPSLN